MFCSKCGAQIPEYSKSCPVCGADVYRPASCNNPIASRKSRLIALILCWFFGIFGVHRFYVGRGWSGVFMILTLGGIGIWAVADFIVILCGDFKDKEGRKLLTWLDQ